jgi:hypothetical protein
VLEEAYVASEVILPLLLTLEHLHHNKIYHRWAPWAGPAQALQEDPCLRLSVDNRFAGLLWALAL